MKLIILKVTDFFDKPGGSVIDTLLPGDPVTSTGNADGPLIEVIIESEAKGWVAKDDCGPDSSARPSVVPAFFVDTCIGVERAFNEIAATAPWYVAADYLIARALLETKIQNVGPSVGSDAVGPLLVSSKEWQRLLSGADPSLQFRRRPDAFDDPLMQIYAGGYTMSADAKAISNAVQKTTAGTSADPFIPSYLNVLHAYFTNVDTAAALLAAIDDDTGRQATVDKFFTGLGANETAQIFANRGNHFGTALQPKTVAQFFDATGTALDQALKDAFGLINQFAPEALPDIKQSEAPWFDVALQQEAAHISAVDNPDVIEKQYFAATNLGPLSKVENWCAAFVAYCMQQSGSPEAAASIPKQNSALAVTWGGWGQGLSVRAEDVPQGAVVVLAPAPNTHTSGHVGFCVQFLDNGKSIQLLGGNQSNRVQRSTFPATKIRAIRWLDLQPSNVRTGFQSDPADPKILISQQAIDLIVFFEVSSQALYEKKYRAPTWPGGRSGATIGIGYDVGYASESQLVNDWTGKIPGPTIDALKAAVGVKGAAAKALLPQLRTVDVPFQAAMSVFSGRDVPRWTKAVQSALPNCNLLSKDSLGALVSLAYNRGASFSAAGSRYAEMRDIKAHMASRDFKLIPDDIRHMKRLWPTVPGLQTRREKEAQLFEQGLANMPVA